MTLSAGGFKLMTSEATAQINRRQIAMQATAGKQRKRSMTPWRNVVTTDAEIRLVTRGAPLASHRSLTTVQRLAVARSHVTGWRDLVVTRLAWVAGCPL